MRGAEAVAAARARLEKAGSELRQRPAAEILATLGRVLDGWGDPASPWRQDLAARLPAHTGFSPPTVRKGLAVGLDHWNGSVLEAVVKREVGDPARLDADGPAAIMGFEHTACVLAGSIPMPTIQALLLPLALRSPVLAKTASRDDLTARAVAQSLAETDPGLGRCVEVVDFDSSDEEASARLLEAPCIVAMGSDSTLSRLRQNVQPHQRWVGYGHRLSVAIKGAQVPGDAWAERMALDIALWDQAGCLSPAAIYVVGNSRDADESAASLANALEAAEKRWPRGDITTATAASIRIERDEARVRQGAGHDVRVLGEDSSPWTLVREDSASWRASPLHRFIRVHPVADAESCAAALRPLGPHLAAVALDAMEGEVPGFDRKLAELGASRIVPAGRMQAPPFDWHHDGQPLLLPIARFCDRA